MGEPCYIPDASAIAKLVLDEAESSAFRAWRETQVKAGAAFVAPSLLGYEVAQLVARNRAGLKLSLEDIVDHVLRGIELVQLHHKVGPFIGPLTAYDASYLAAAAEVGGVLVTYDEQMARVAALHGITVIAP